MHFKEVISVLEKRSIINVRNIGVVKRVGKPVKPNKWGIVVKNVFDVILQIVAVACFLIGACLAFGA